MSKPFTAVRMAQAEGKTQVQLKVGSRWVTHFESANWSEAYAEARRKADELNKTNV